MAYEKLPTFLGAGVLIVLAIFLPTVYIYVDQSKHQSEKNGNDISSINSTVMTFIKKFDERTKISDERAAAQNKSNAVMTHKLDRGYEQILKSQNISNQSGQKLVKQLFATEDNILGNLTRHRIVTNTTFDEIKSMLRNKTG